MSEPMDADAQKFRPKKPNEAREQAAEYLGFMAGFPIDIGDGEVWECPNPGLLDEEQQRAKDQLDLDLELLDKEDVEIRDAKGQVVRTESRIKMPHRINGSLVDNYDLRLCKVLMGDDVYKKFKAAGGRPGDIGVWFMQMNKQLAERRAADAKSGPSTGAVDPVPAGD